MEIGTAVKKTRKHAKYIFKVFKSLLHLISPQFQ